MSEETTRKEDQHNAHIRTARIGFLKEYVSFSGFVQIGD